MYKNMQEIDFHLENGVSTLSGKIWDIDIRKGTEDTIYIVKHGDKFLKVPSSYVVGLHKTKKIKENTKKQKAEDHTTATTEKLRKVSLLLDKAIEEDVIKRSGAWYKFNDQSLGKNKNEACKHIYHDNELFDELSEAVNK